MTYKQVLFESAAREKLLRGVTALSDAVRVTLGPKSKRVLIEKKWGAPLVCDDGVTIAKEFDLKDPVENLGVRTLRQAAERTGEAVGDGTTTSTLLAHAIFAEGVRNVVAGASAINLKRGLERGLAAAVKSLSQQSRPVQSKKERAQVATISAHNDIKMGSIVADAYERVGDEGVISVEEARTTETTLEVVNGMQFDRGYLSPYFVTDPERMECVLEDPLILIHGPKIASIKDLVPFLELAVKSARPLLIIAEDVEGDALATLVVNKLRGSLLCCAVKAPGFGERRQAMLEDIAILTGGQMFSAELGRKLENADLSDAGHASRIVIDKDKTTIVAGKGDKNRIHARIEQLRRQIKETTSDYDKEKLQERLAKLTGGVAVIKAGAPSEAELKSIKEAFDDAINSTKAAIAEGIVPGAGLALLRARAAVAQEEAAATGDERTGLNILTHALEAPTRQIAKNSGLDGGVVLERMSQAGGHIGLNAATGDYVDLYEAGIVDPTKVVRTALENAVSVASVLLLTEATLTEVPEPPKPAAAAAAPAYGEEF
ncbi:MAG TPA: chaperonin GroEL [Polyangiaceae bacterium]|nr:chaperonin GroEL [Polyangiaceae bacterium]